MAEGFSNRIKLSLPPAPEGQEEHQHELERWARSLPFAACGFRAWANTTGSAFAIGANVVKFNTFLDNKEGFVFDAPGRVVVPKGKSGLYMINVQCYFGTPVSNAFFGGPTVNGLFVTQGTQEAISLDRVQATTPALLNDGDVLGLQVNCSSPAAGASTSLSGPGNGIYYPILQAWRIAYLK